MKRIGSWYRKVKEAFDRVEPASSLISSRNVLLTRRDNTLCDNTVYVVLQREPVGEGVKLKPIQQENSWNSALIPSLQ